MTLESNNQVLRSLVFSAEGKEKYNREILRLKDLLADDNRFLPGALRRLAADLLGINVSTLQHRMRKLGIDCKRKVTLQKKSWLTLFPVFVYFSACINHPTLVTPLKSEKVR